MGPLSADDWHAKWISAPEDNADIAAWLRKSFDLPAAPNGRP